MGVVDEVQIAPLGSLGSKRPKHLLRFMPKVAGRLYGPDVALGGGGSSAVYCGTAKKILTSVSARQSLSKSQL